MVLPKTRKSAQPLCVMPLSLHSPPAWWLSFLLILALLSKFLSQQSDFLSLGIQLRLGSMADNRGMRCVELSESQASRGMLVMEDRTLELKTGTLFPRLVGTYQLSKPCWHTLLRVQRAAALSYLWTASCSLVIRSKEKEGQIQICIRSFAD